ncbi:transmembrane protein 273-like isoform X1 [Megalops cyprinoides]|uniref:transmembrane protein 273-like isoform X1 n=1 Tax=Megalops cyprinoides TaxID=118141 RepID=UPI00186452DA|nr:transmembrane protein 273-like isoform X1 [Megalops cyprinoides]
MTFRFFSGIAVVLLIDTLLMKVHGNDPNSTNETEVKYAIIGAGIGLFFSVIFVVVKLYMLKKHMLDNDLSDTEQSRKLSVRTVMVDLRKDSR